MKERSDNRLVQRLSTCASASAIFSAMVGLSGLAGWAFHIPRLTTWGISPVKMVANTAAGLTLLGAALWLLRNGEPRHATGTRKLIANCAASVAAVVGLLSLAEHALGRSFGIDQILFAVSSTEVAPGLRPGLMSWITGFNFAMLGLAFLLLDWKTRRGDWPAQFFSLGAMTGAAFGFFALVLEPTRSPTTVAWPTAVTCWALAFGVLCARPTLAVGGLLVSQSAGARLLRKAVPATLLVLGIIGWFISKPLLTDASLTWVQASVLAIFCAMLLAAFLAWIAFAIDRGDRERQTLKAAVGIGEEQLDRLLGRVEEPQAENRLRWQVRGGFAAAIFLTALLGFLSWYNAREAAEDAAWVAHSREVSTTLELTLRHLLDVESGGRGYALSGETPFLEPYESGKRAVGQDLQALRILLADNPNQELRLDQLQNQAKRRIDAANTLVASRRNSGMYPPGEDFELGKQLMEAVRATIGEMEIEETHLLKQRARRTETAQYFTGSAIWLGSILGIGLLSISGFTLNREIRIGARARAHVNALNADLERRVAERTAALSESESRLAGVIQSATDSIITVDEQQRIILFNAAAEKIFRCQAAEAMGQSITRFIPERYHAAHSGHIERYGETGETARAMGAKNVLWAVRADGQEFQIEASISQVIAGRKKLFTVILRDVTERVQAEELRDRLAAIVDSSEDAIISKDLKGTITAWNRGAEKIFGYSASETVGKPMVMLFPPELIKEESEILACIGRGESVDHYETVRMRKDEAPGDNVWVAISPIRNSSGTVVGASKIAHDITERKRTEQARQRAEERYRRFVERTAAGVLRNTLDGRIIESNDAMVQMLGYSSRVEFLSRPTPELHYVNPEDRRSLVERLKERGALNNYEVCFQRKDGKPVWVVMSLVLVKDEGEAEGVIEATVVDITARKEAENRMAVQALDLAVSRETLEEQARVLDLAPVMVRDMDGRIAFWPPGAEALYGFTSQEALTNLARELLHTQFPEPVETIEKTLLESGRWEGELSHRKRDGSVIFVASVWVLYRDLRGNPLQILEASTDITARKRAEERLEAQAGELSRQAEKLRQSQHAFETKSRMLQLVLDSIGEGLVASDGEGRFLIWNDSARDLMGRDAADMPTEQWTPHYKIFLPDGITPFPPECLPLVRSLSGESVRAEMFIQNPQHEAGTFLEVTSRPMKDTQGNLCGGVAVLRDITERKRADAALARQAEQLSRQTGELLQSQQALEAQKLMLRSVLDSMEEGLIAANEEGKFIIWNPAAEKILGLGATDVASEECNAHYQLYTLDTVTPLPPEGNPLTRAIRGEVSMTEIFVRNPTLEEGAWIEASGSPLKNKEGAIRGGVVAFRDITTRKKADQRLAWQSEQLSRQTEELLNSQQALEAQKRILTSVLDSMSEGLVATDEKGKFILWNPAAARIVGLGPSDLDPTEWTAHYGVYLPDRVTPLPTEQNPSLRAIRGETCTAELYVHNPELPEGVWIELSATPLKDTEGKVRGGVSAFRDITQRKTDEAEIHKLNEELEERVAMRTAELAAANGELEAFTYSVSHDLRAPLRHMSGFTKILVEDFGPSLPEEAQKHLQRIESGAHRMGQLVDELLNLARVGRQTLTVQSTGLGPIVKDILAMLEPESDGRQIEWKIAELPFVECDPTLIRLVFQNLIGNALKYSQPRSPAVIEIGQIQQNGNLTIFVRDNGVGFSMKYADKLFGVFQRLHRAEEFEGTGVGLATVQRIIQKHGGRIWAEAELDRGATFYFTLGAHSSERAVAAAGGQL